MRWWLILLGLAIGVASYFLLSGILLWVGVGIGVILLIWGFFSKKKQQMTQQAPAQPMMGNPVQMQAMQ